METHWPALLATYLDSLEGIIRNDLADPRTARNSEAARLRRLDLTDALEAVSIARAELTRCPEGAALALHVVGAVQHWLRLKAESAELKYRNALKGLTAAKPKRDKRTAQRHAKIRAKAAKLNPKLTAVAKADILKRTSTLGPRQIRRIIKK